MSRPVEPISVPEGGEVARLLDRAAAGPVVLERGGVLYRLGRIGAEADESADPWATYDPQAVLAAIDAAAGTWSDIDAEALKAHIYRAREEGTRPE